MHCITSICYIKRILAKGKHVGEEASPNTLDTATNGNRKLGLQCLDAPIYWYESSSAFCRRSMQLHKPQHVLGTAKNTVSCGVFGCFR